jgi:predicted RNA-binding protein (virulence factor B family)
LKVKGKLVAKLASKQDVLLKPEKELVLKSSVKGFIQRIGQEGANVLTEDGHFIFVHKSMIKESIRYGEEVEVKVTYLSEKGYTGSLAEQKEVQLFEDANMILSSSFVWKRCH